MTLTSAQQFAVESIDKSVLVAAGAGSGKTRVLVERFVEILRRRPDVSVSNIMAVTYTRKAAAEMRTRLKEHIQKLVQETSGSEQERWGECLFAIDSARIGTIHSVCESILRNFPAEASVDPKFEIVDDLEREELIESSIDQSFREIITEQGIEHSVLLGLSLSEIERCLRSIINYSIEFNEAASFLDNSDLADFYYNLRSQLRKTQSRIVADITKNGEWLDAAQFLRNNSLADPKSMLELMRKAMLGFLDEIETSPGAENEHGIAKSWQALRSMLEIKPGNSGGSKSEAKSLRQAIKALRELAEKFTAEIPVNVTESDCFDWELVTALIRLAKRTLTIYQAKKREIHKLDYNDLVLLTFSALRQSDSEVRLYYHDALKEILVDEFQDTNRTQASLLAYLAGPKTNLFLIGDDKQSIYKFQGADVSIFNEWHRYFRNNLEDALYGDIFITGERAVLTLGESFRSHPSLVNFVNGIFRQLLGEEEVSIQYRARYRELTAARSDNESGNDPGEDAKNALNSRVEVLSFNASVNGERASRAAANQMEADLVADWITNKISSGAKVTNADGSTRPIEFGDFGILVSRNSDCATFEPALAAQGIPYVAYSGKGFLDRQEVYDIENMLAFLANPDNDHALLAVLRSPICSLSDDLIHNLFANKSGKLWLLLQQEAAVNRSGYQAVSRAVLVLKRFLADLPTKTLGELVQNIVSKSNYDLILMGLPNGKQRSRNLWKTVNLASLNEQMNCAEFVAYMKSMRHFSVKQSDAPLDTSNAVKLMTIHAAKGLEFPAVILPALHVSAHGKKQRILFHRQYGLALNTARTKDEAKPLWYTLATVLDKDMELAEKKRLLYVAMTRARDYLALFLNETGRKEESFSLWLKPLLRLESTGEGENETDPIQSRTLTVRNSSAKFFHCQYDESNLLLDSGRGTPAKESARAGGIQLDFSVPNDSSYQTDLLEPVLSERLEPPTVRNGWLRLTPKSGDFEMDARMLGTFFHTLMEFLSERTTMPDETELLAIAALQGEVAAHPIITKHLIEEAKPLLEKFFESDLHKLIRSAKQILHELPYYRISSLASTIGRPDLVIETDQSKWLIIDYKTDRFPTDAMAAQARTHAKQLERYRKDLSDVTGIEANSAIYFAQHGILYRLEQHA